MEVDEISNACRLTPSNFDLFWFGTFPYHLFFWYAKNLKVGTTSMILVHRNHDDGISTFQVAQMFRFSDCCLCTFRL